MKDGTPFERLAASIFEQLRNDPAYETVEHDVSLPGPDGPRQIDVLLRGKVGPVAVTTIVECKDYADMVTVQEVDALHSKMQDVKAHKAVLVARKGFSKGARMKAARVGISLCTAHQAKSEKWPFQLQLPFVVEDISCWRCALFFRFTAMATSHEFDRSKVNGIPVERLIADYLNSHPVQFDGDATTVALTPPIPEPHWIYIDGKRELVTHCRIEVGIKRSFYFGYFNDLESAQCLEFVEEQQRHVIFDSKEVMDYRAKLARYRKREEVPAVPNLAELKLHVVEVFNVSDPKGPTATRVAEPST